MKRKIHTILCCVIVGVLALTGCGSNSGSRNSYQIKSSTVTGTVESIDDDKITVSLSSGNMPGGMPGGQTPPEMPGQSSEEASQDGSTGQTDQQAPPEKPEGENTDQQASEQSDSAKENESSTQLVLTIEDSSVLQDEDEKQLISLISKKVTS